MTKASEDTPRRVSPQGIPGVSFPETRGPGLEGPGGREEGLKGPRRSWEEESDGESGRRPEIWGATVCSCYIVWMDLG